MSTATITDTNSETLAQLRALWKDLRPAADRLSKQATDLKTLAKNLSTPEGYLALKKLQKDLENLRALEMETETLVRDARAAGQQVEEWLSQEWGRRGSEFGNELKAHFQDRAVVVELDGSILQVGHFQVVMQPEQDRALLRYLDEDVATAKLSCETIFKAWQTAKDAMEKAQASPSNLASALLEAYDDLCRTQGKPAGARMRLPDLLFGLFVARQPSAVRQDPRQNKVKDYRRYQFAHDLSLLLERQGDGLTVSHEGRHLIFHQASKSAARASSVKVESGAGMVALSDLEVSG